MIVSMANIVCMHIYTMCVGLVYEEIMACIVHFLSDSENLTSLTGS